MEKKTETFERLVDALKTRDLIAVSELKAEDRLNKYYVERYSRHFMLDENGNYINVLRKDVENGRTGKAIASSITMKFSERMENKPEGYVPTRITKQVRF